MKLCSKCEIEPFAYGVDYNIIFEDSMGYAYQCPSCGKSTDWYRSEEEARLAWNEANCDAP